MRLNIESRDYTCVIVAPKHITQVIQQAIGEGVNTISCSRTRSLNAFIEQFYAPVVLIYMDKEVCNSLYNTVLSLKNNFNQIQIIVILDEVNLDIALKCGALGADKVIPLSDLHQLPIAIKSMIISGQPRITLPELGVVVDSYARLTQKALLFLEKNYLNLLGINEISDHLGITESSLSRLFKEANLVNPKRAIMCLKTLHATRLMKNDGLGLKSISYLSGFTGQRRFNECFQRVLGCSPIEFREKFMHNQEGSQMINLINIKAGNHILTD